MRRRASVFPAAALAIGMASAATAQGIATIHAVDGATRVYMQTSSQRITYTSSGSSTVALMRNIVIPPERGGVLVATFSAESKCSSLSTGPASCSVQIWCDGMELSPEDLGDFSFSSSTSGLSNVSIIRYSQFVGFGPHTCSVMAVTPQGAKHELDDWIFTVEFWHMAG